MALLQAPLLRRADTLAADLDQLHGPGWAAALPLVPAARDYAARLQAAATTVLVAHAYVRYLGDLHGGQLLRRRVAKSLGLEGDEGTRFYDFGAEDQVRALREGLRDALGRLPVTTTEADAIVAEACWGFGQHCRLFDELASV